MLKHLGCAAAIATAFCSVTGANAGDPHLGGQHPRVYVSASGGLNDAINAQFHSNGSNGEIAGDRGWTGAIALGLRLDSNIRTELELAMHQNDLDHIQINGLGTLGVVGEMNVTSAIARVAYDLPMQWIEPYVAAGVGLAQYSIDFDSPFVGSDRKTTIAGEVEGGLSVPLSDNIDLFSSVQLLVLADFHIDPTGSGGAELAHPMFLSGIAGLRIGF